MHVNNNQISSSFDLAVDNQHAHSSPQTGVINTRPAVVINTFTKGTDVAKSANSINSQFAKLTPQTQSEKSIKASFIHKDPIQKEPIKETPIGECPDVEDLLNQMNQACSNGISHDQYSAICGDEVFRADSPELLEKDPSEIDSKLLVLKRQNGELALAVTQDQLNLLRNKNLTYVDANGQTRRYSFVVIDNSTQDRLQVALDKFHQTHIAPLLKQKESDSAEERTPFISTCLKSVTKITTQEKIDRRDNEPVDPKVQELAEKIDRLFPTTKSIIAKKVEAERVKEKEAIELEKKNLEIIHKIVDKSIKLFTSFQERVKTDHESGSIALSEQNHMRTAHTFKPIRMAETTL